MTVKELIKLLKKYPEDMNVVVNGYEEGWCDIEQKSVSEIEIALNYNKEDYCGPHEDVSFILDKKKLQNYKTKKVVAISR